MRNPQRSQSNQNALKHQSNRKERVSFIRKKITYQGTEFDSRTEFLFYRHLKNVPTVKEIKLQPIYQIIESYEVTCKRCSGTRKWTGPKTGKLINFSICKGKRTRVKAGSIYTADFKLTYIDGFGKIIDVKGGPVTRDFPLRRRLFEKKTGMELIIVRLGNKEWVGK